MMAENRRSSNLYVFRLKIKPSNACGTTKGSQLVKECEAIQDWNTTKKKEGKGALVHAVNARKVQQRYSPSHNYPRRWVVASGQIYILAALLQKKKKPTVPLKWMLGGPKSVSGRFG